MKKMLKICSVFLLLVFLFTGCSTKVEKRLEKESKQLSSYKIEAEFFEEEKTIYAKETINYINKSDVILDNICFHLYGTAFSEDASIKPYALSSTTKCFPNEVNYGDMQIESVKEYENNSNYEIIGEDNNILKVLLFTPIGSGESVELVITFKTILANCTHRLGYFENNVNLGNWYPIACVFQEGQFCMTPYYSSGDPFYSDCANYNVKINYPSSYNCASTGNIQDEIIDGTNTIRTYEALVVRDFAIQLAKDVTKVSSKVGNTEIDIVCSNKDESINIYLETAVKAVEFFNEEFGEYPYKTLSVCFTDFLHGGMEYPNIVFISNSVDELIEIKKIIIHEIAHQWWYGVVGNDEVSDAWIDESLAEYSTLLYFEHYGEDNITRQSLIDNATSNYLLYEDVIKSLKININESMQSKIYEYGNEYEYVYMVYIKGLVFIDELRDAIGDENFFKGLKSLYKDNMFKNVKKEEFLLAFEKNSGLDLDSFVEEWLSGKVGIE